MNEQNDFERLVADQLSNAAVGAPPANAIEDTIARAGGNRRLPEWLALIKEPPMRTNSKVAVGSPTVRVMAVLAATMFLILAMAAIGVGAQRLLADGRIVVAEDGSGTHTTLAAAIADSADGDEILIRPGSYAESIVTDKSVSLTGDGPLGEIVITHLEDAPRLYENAESSKQLEDWLATPDEVDAVLGEDGGVGYALVLVGSTATVSNLTFSGEDARLFIDGGSPVVENVTFERVGVPFSEPPEESVPLTYRGPSVQALVITGSATPTVRENSFIGGGGITIYALASPHIERNTLEGAGGIYGSQFGFGEDTRIIDNHLYGQGWHGIDLLWDASTTVSGNLVEDKAYGMFLDGRATAQDNEIRNSTEAAIYVLTSGPTIENNRFHDNAVAIQWTRGDGAIRANEVIGGTRGLLIESGSPVVSDNTVEGVREAGIVVETMARPVITGNRSCGNGEDLRVANLARPEIYDTNETCAPRPTE